MTNTIRKNSILSGLSLLIMAIAAGVAYGYMHTELLKDLLFNIQNTSLLSIEIVLWIVVVITDLLVTYGFYQVLKPTHQTLALISSTIRLIYTFILTMAVFQLVTLWFNSSTTNVTEALNAFTNFESIWSFGLIIFGFHLLLVGVTTLKGHFPKILAYLLIIAGLGYIVIHLLQNIAPALEVTQTIESIMVIPMTLGELGFGLWLLFKGGKSLH